MTATTLAHSDDQQHQADTTSETNKTRNHFVERWFSSEGRLNRAAFIGGVLVLYVANFVIGFALGVLLGVQAAMTGTSPSVLQQEAQVLGSLVGLIALWPIVCQGVKRLHDLGRPGWHYCLLFVPFYNLYLAGLMLFKEGATGQNAFGSDPLRSTAHIAPVPEVEGLQPASN